MKSAVKSKLGSKPAATPSPKAESKSIVTQSAADERRLRKLKVFLKSVSYNGSEGTRFESLNDLYCDQLLLDRTPCSDLLTLGEFKCNPTPFLVASCFNRTQVSNKGGKGSRRAPYPRNTHRKPPAARRSTTPAGGKTGVAVGRGSAGSGSTQPQRSPAKGHCPVNSPPVRFSPAKQGRPVGTGQRQENGPVSSISPVRRTTGNVNGRTLQGPIKTVESPKRVNESNIHCPVNRPGIQPAYSKQNKTGGCKDSEATDATKVVHVREMVSAKKVVNLNSQRPGNGPNIKLSDKHTSPVSNNDSGGVTNERAKAMMTTKTPDSGTRPENGPPVQKTPAKQSSTPEPQNEKLSGSDYKGVKTLDSLNATPELKLSKDGNVNGEFKAPNTKTTEEAKVMKQAGNEGVKSKTIDGGNVNPAKNENRLVSLSKSVPLDSLGKSHSSLTVTNDAILKAAPTSKHFKIQLGLMQQRAKGGDSFRAAVIQMKGVNQSEVKPQALTVIIPRVVDAGTTTQEKVAAKPQVQSPGKPQAQSTDEIQSNYSRDLLGNKATENKSEAKQESVGIVSQEQPDLHNMRRESEATSTHIASPEKDAHDKGKDKSSTIAEYKSVAKQPESKVDCKASVTVLTENNKDDNNSIQEEELEPAGEVKRPVVDSSKHEPAVVLKEESAVNADKTESPAAPIQIKEPARETDTENLPKPNPKTTREESGVKTVKQSKEQWPIVAVRSSNRIAARSRGRQEAPRARDRPARK